MPGTRFPERSLVSGGAEHILDAIAFIELGPGIALRLLGLLLFAQPYSLAGFLGGVQVSTF